MSIIHDNNGNAFGELNPMLIKTLSRQQKTVQLFNAVSMPATNGSSTSSWIDTQGFVDLAYTFASDASGNNNTDIYWSHDGINIHGYEVGLTTSTSRNRAYHTPIKARYMRAVIYNTDASPKTMSAWAYLKA